MAHSTLLTIGLDLLLIFGHCHIDPPHCLAGVSSFLVTFSIIVFDLRNNYLLKDSI